MALSRDQVISALRAVRDPQLAKDIVTLGRVSDIRLDGDDVYLRMELGDARSAAGQTIRRDIEQALTRAGAREIFVQAEPPRSTGGAAAGSAGAAGGAEAASPHGPASGAVASAAGAQSAPRALPQVRNIIAVGAGKGGVGKSTIAVNLAIGLRRLGAAVGLMDGDIYGPSMPTLLGIKGRSPELMGNKILPFQVHGIVAVTIGALVEQDKPLIWRGPMAHGAFKQLLIDNTPWPPLDYLIVDLPPGTGDVPLSLCQMLPITGAVIVATPQQVALDDAVRAARMFQQLETPILGLIENMSYFVSPDGAEHDIFGRGGTERAAQELALPYLGALPMFTEVRVNSDAGRPEANYQGSPRLRAALEAIVTNLVNEITKRNASPSGPTLTVQ